jgi:hypothetical protein
MHRRGVLGSCFPAIWIPTSTEGGYTFPFLEMRSRTTLHPGTQAVATQMGAVGNVVVRSMDADVMNDPLLEGRVTAAELQPLTDKMDEYTPFALTGGYDWNTAAPPEKIKDPVSGKQVYFWGQPAVTARITDVLATKWSQIITLINAAEHARRVRLAQVRASLVYWPEPNTYMSADVRLEGAKSVDEFKGHQTKDSQQRESIFYLREPARTGQLEGAHDPAMTSTKPVKTYFDWLRDWLLAQELPKTRSMVPKPPELPAVKSAIENIRQTHLSPDHIADIQKETWYGVRDPLDSQTKDTLEQERIAAVAALAQGVRDVITR